MSYEITCPHCHVSHYYDMDDCDYNDDAANEVECVNCDCYFTAVCNINVDFVPMNPALELKLAEEALTLTIGRIVRHETKRRHTDEEWVSYYARNLIDKLTANLREVLELHHRNEFNQNRLNEKN